jgi:hypothetical protein
MAFEADRVVVELIAQNEQFDAATKASSQNFQQSMAGIKTTGAQAEAGVGQFSSALKANRLEMNQSRIGMMEFQHIARGVSDQIAAGAPPTQILTQHLGMLGEAVALSGGAFGAFGEFLMGPWGLALTFATVVGAKLLVNLLDQKNALDEAFDKLVKNKEQTEENTKAYEIWSHTLDGLIERTKKLTDELDKQTITQSALNDQIQRSAREQFAAALSAEARLEASGASPDTLKKVSGEVTAAALALHEAQQVATEAAAKGSTDLSQAAKDWIDAQRRMMEQIAGEHPELVNNEAIQQAVDLFDKAAENAASAKMPFATFANEVHALDTKLLDGSISADTFAQKVRGLASALTASTDAFKNQDNAVSRFKQSVIGAEGVGPNRLGSSAAGFGQFMPSTFESYFKQLYPQQAASMSNEQIDALRNNRQVAEAVIDAATKDYVAVLQRAGQQITEASLYTVHLLGANDARKLFSAAPGTPTSSFLSQGVLAGNPFLRGTASDALAAIGQRIGGSSSAVSAGAAAIQQQLNKDLAEEVKQHEHVLDLLSKGLDISKEITAEATKQGSVFVEMPKDIEAAAAAEAQFKEHIKQVSDAMQEAKQIGGELVDDVLNPSNWDDWGNAAHRVLHDVLAQLFTLAAINPLKNALFGGNLPTLAGVFGSLFGGGGFDSDGVRTDRGLERDFAWASGELLPRRWRAGQRRPALRRWRGGAGGVRSVCLGLDHP